MLHPAYIAAVWKQRHMPRVEAQCINTSSRAKSNYTPSNYGGGFYYICLCFFCALETQKRAKNKQ